MNAVAVLVLLAAMAGSWGCRAVLLRMLRARHPLEFEGLGRPSIRSLESMLPRHGEQQLRFWQYIWGDQSLRVADPSVRRLAWTARGCDVALVASVVVLFMTAAR